MKRIFEVKRVIKAVDSIRQEMEQSAEELCSSTSGGRFHLRQDKNGNTTAMGQLALFAKLMEVTGLFPVR
ncbi:hypothetical protein [Nitrosomonas communis]|uniref:hypothetical protein n=1 Tax=Nitrosomonas communis TaxID=44574 RepID=UPI00094242BF|nr:hypothetical protein [Nitrosomonas communis]